MYEKEIEKKMSELDRALYDLRFANRKFYHNPIKKNRQQCFKECEHISKILFQYQELLNSFWLKGQR